MKHGYFLFFLTIILLPVICRGQGDTVYYDYSAIRTTNIKEAIDYCVYQPEAGHNFSGKKYTVKGNLLESIGYYSSIDPIMQDGHFADYENGAVTGEGAYNHNKKTGMWTYYRSGTKTKWYTETYSSDEKIKLKSYFPNGKLKRKEKHNDTYTKATGKCFNEKGKKRPFTTFYTAPRPMYRIDQYLAENLRYPDSARDQSIEGTVILRFLVNEDGNITNIEVVKGIAASCNKEAERVISGMPKWIGGIKDDKTVKVQFYQPVTFRLQ